jgi:hypothetical protein
MFDIPGSTIRNNQFLFSEKCYSTKANLFTFKGVENYLFSGSKFKISCDKCKESGKPNEKQKYGNVSE